jgi:DNA-directed RNA polymerase subunit omega
MKLYAMKDLLQGEDSRYMLVNMVAHRAREIAVDAEKDQVSLTEKPVTMALEEAAAGQLIDDTEEEAE